VYVVDPDTETAQCCRIGMVVSVVPIPDVNALLLNEVVRLSLISAAGINWRTRRLSWDGLRNLVVIKDFVHGEGWSPDGIWHKFEVSLDTGEAVGGARMRNLSLFKRWSRP
jgi:hypothetical protein